MLTSEKELREARLPLTRMATIDHLDHKFDSTRGAAGDGVTERTVLACWKCNQKRGKRDDRKHKRLQLFKTHVGSLKKELVDHIRSVIADLQMSTVSSSEIESQDQVDTNSDVLMATEQQQTETLRHE